MNPSRHPFDHRGPLPLEVERERSHVVVRPVGDLDAASSPALRSCLAGLLDSGADDLVVELGAVPFCDSTGLGVLVGAHRRLAVSGGHLAVGHPLPPVRHLLEISGLDRVFDVR
ncbi:STAS domain-containing protein [Aquihabitans sp. G128]|uniref:STAS domain-containing protein n=1 Tax=Aquihabitans sp. G128 TaxID=2849779 RepID=UPI001C2307C3|nr:STAS domain-containing protein [Aquihabitans sp. G128]QXC61655.1 STAS domain-containing protein [Aquihabitans sp. G128]